MPDRLPSREQVLSSLVTRLEKVRRTLTDEQFAQLRRDLTAMTERFRAIDPRKRGSPSPATGVLHMFKEPKVRPSRQGWYHEPMPNVQANRNGKTPPRRYRWVEGVGSRVRPEPLTDVARGTFGST